MKKSLIIILLALLILSCSKKGQEAMIQEHIHRVENGLISQQIINFKSGEIKFDMLEKIFQPGKAELKLLETLTQRMKHHATPGVSVAVINNGHIQWAKAYGIMDVKTGFPVTKETIFEAASTSKLVTAVMALYFVEKGLIELDRDVNSYLKSWKLPENQHTETEKVTLRRLLTHQSGLPSTSYDHDEKAGYPSLIDVLNGKSPAENRAAVPEFVPGTKWRYSNLGFNVIQLLLEDISGKSFQQIAGEILFNPLEMKNSTFIYPLDEVRKKREAMPHDSQGRPRKPAMHRTALAQGGLTTTPTDLAKFTVALIHCYQGRSEKILSQKMIRRMFSRECDIDRKRFPLPFYQGLGVFLMGEGRDLMFTHPGNNYPGLNCWLIGWPEQGTGAVIMDNAANNGILGLEIIYAINREYNQ